MKEYLVIGYMMDKNHEDKGWQKINDGVSIKLPDDVNPYEAVGSQFKLVASHWMFSIEEKKLQEE